VLSHKGTPFDPRLVVVRHHRYALSVVRPDAAQSLHRDGKPPPAPDPVAHDLRRSTAAGEPYSLAFKWRKGGTGQEYLYVWDQTGGRSSGPGIKSLLNWKVTSIENTDIKFEPRFEIELAKAGEYGERTTFSSSRRAGVLRSTRTRQRPQARYQVRCAYCQREFDRIRPSTVIRRHQDSYGNPCPGRRGYRI